MNTETWRQLLYRFQHYNTDFTDERLIFEHEQHEVLKSLLDRWVSPHAPTHPSVLDVGFGSRVEELAALMTLNPTAIVGVDHGWRAEELGELKWKLYVDTLQKIEQQKYRQTVSLHTNRDVRTIPFETFDIVCAFRIDPTLQNENDIALLVELSSGLVVVSSWRDSGIKWGIDDNGYDHPSLHRTEEEHIDHLLEPYRQYLIHTKQPVDAEESHIWVLKKP